jgi:hypothetical protein
LLQPVVAVAVVKRQARLLELLAVPVAAVQTLEQAAQVFQRKVLQEAALLLRVAVAAAVAL